MRRDLIASLSLVGLAALSCGPFDEVLVVEAAPNAATAEVAEPVDPALAELDGSDYPDVGEPIVVSDYDRVLAELLDRHTGLPHHELPALALTIVEEADRHDFDPALVMAVIEVESGYYHRAVSHVGAMGLMQLLPPTAAELAGKMDLPWHGSESLYDPILNVKLGCAYLKELEEKFGSISTALAAYNWGPGAIHRRLRSGHSVPVKYVDKVMASYEVGRRT